MLEPLGIISGSSAASAVEQGQASWLAGGPSAFCFVREIGAAALIPISRCADPLDSLTRRCPDWAGLSPGPSVMGILNVTPDSFSDGSGERSVGGLIARGVEMVAQGAAVVDVGGESTRPGAAPVSVEEEQARTLPVISGLARKGVLVSVDTRNADTMARALDAGATIVNDVSALGYDKESARVVAARRCPVILMHMRGTPRTMGSLATYGDVATDVFRELEASVRAAEVAGIERSRIAIDPGFGFAKTPAQSRELLERLALFVNLRCPIIAGMSRKSFLGKMSGVVDAADRDPPSVAAGILALTLGARVLRVHNVAATAAAVRVWQSMQATLVPKTGD